MDAVHDLSTVGPLGASTYSGRRPEETLLYQVIDENYAEFIARLDAQGRRKEDGGKRGTARGRGAAAGAATAMGVERSVSTAFPVRSNPVAMGESLRVVYRAISAFLVHKARLTWRQAQCGAVTFIQRFGSALNLNEHFHMLVPDGVYLTSTEAPYFRRLSAPTLAEIQALVEQIGNRIGRHLERRGLLLRDAESAHLSLESSGAEEGLADLQSHSITYRIAFGANRGRKALTLQSLPPASGVASAERVAQSSGFSLHAGVATEASDRDKLERLCRYISRPAVASERLSQSADGRIRYTLKTPYRDGTTHVLFEPLDFLSRLAALVPSPGVNLTRYHGVFAPNHRLRAQIVPSRRGRALAPADGSGGERKHVPLGWAQRLKRVFGIEIQRCEHCGGTVRIIASIEDPEVIARILAHRELARIGQVPGAGTARGPPSVTSELFD